jgi:hypothetical protein
LESLFDGYKKNKAGKAGFSWRVPKTIGIDSIRNECKHFNEWIQKLISFSPSLKKCD